MNDYTFIDSIDISDSSSGTDEFIVVGSSASADAENDSINSVSSDNSDMSEFDFDSSELVSLLTENNTDLDSIVEKLDTIISFQTCVFYVFVAFVTISIFRKLFDVFRF